jgi:hypothetical protein
MLGKLICKIKGHRHPWWYIDEWMNNYKKINVDEFTLEWYCTRCNKRLKYICIPKLGVIIA